MNVNMQCCICCIATVWVCVCVRVRMWVDAGAVVVGVTAHDPSLSPSPRKHSYNSGVC